MDQKERKCSDKERKDGSDDEKNIKPEEDCSVQTSSGDLQNYEAYGARPKIRIPQSNGPSTSKASSNASHSVCTDSGVSATSKSSGNLKTYKEISCSSRSLEDDSSSQEETVETVEERMREQSRPTCTTSKNSIIVHTNYFPKHMLPHNLGNNRLSGDMSVFDTPDDNMSNIVDFIEADIARVYLQGSNSSRGSSTGDLCDTTSNVSSIPHENISGLAHSDTESDLREKDRPVSEGDTETLCDSKKIDGAEHVRNTPQSSSNPSLHLQETNTVTVPTSHTSNRRVENKLDVDYLDLDLDADTQYSPEYLQSNSSESNFQYGMMDERSLSVELGYNTDSFSDGIGPLGGDSTKSGDKTDSETNSDEFPFSDGYGTIKARESSSKNKIQNPSDNKDRFNSTCNSQGEPNGWEHSQPEDLYSVNRQASSKFDQDENSSHEQDIESGYKLVCMVDPVKKSSKKSRDKHSSHNNNLVNMDNDPILNANRSLPNNNLRLDERRLYVPELRPPRSLMVNRERRAASLEDSDILGSCQRKINIENRKAVRKGQRLDLTSPCLDGERLPNNGAAHMPCYSLPLLPQELDSIRHGLDDCHAGIDFREGLADLHLASQEQWDEYMALSRSLSSSR